MLVAELHVDFVAIGDTAYIEALKEAELVADDVVVVQVQLPADGQLADVGQLAHLLYLLHDFYKQGARLFAVNCHLQVQLGRRHGCGHRPKGHGG